MKQIDFDQLEIMTNLISDNLEIYNYLSDNMIDSVVVTINNDYSFDIKDEMMKKAMDSFKKQLETRITDLTQQLKLNI